MSSSWSGVVLLLVLVALATLDGTVAARLGRRVRGRAIATSEWQGLPAMPHSRPPGTIHFHFSSDDQACECVSSGLPTSGDKYIEYTPDGDDTPIKLPANYGEKCRAWDEKSDPKCQSKYPPAYCLEKWCYVDKRCKVKDVKKSLLFPEHGELYFSYQNCGSLDSYTALACLEKKKPKCAEPCAWNDEHGCQNKLCQCTGDNSAFSKQDAAFYGKDYGTMCSAWDESSCEGSWQGKTKLGLWCCKSWCYVEELCPSAKPSSVKPSLFYSYHACPDNVDALMQCPHKDPVDFEGKPLPLSPKAAEALSKSGGAGRDGLVMPGFTMCFLLMAAGAA